MIGDTWEDSEVWLIGDWIGEYSLEITIWEPSSPKQMMETK